MPEFGPRWWWITWSFAACGGRNRHPRPCTLPPRDDTLDQNRGLKLLVGSESGSVAIANSASLTWAWVRSAPVMLAPDNFVNTRRPRGWPVGLSNSMLPSWAWTSRAPVKSAPSKFAPDRWAKLKSAPARLAPRRSANIKCARVRTAPLRSQPLRSAASRKMPARSFPANEVSASPARSPVIAVGIHPQGVVPKQGLKTRGHGGCPGAKLGPREISLCQLDPGQNCAMEHRPSEASPSDIGVLKAGGRQISVLEGGETQSGAGEIAAPEVRAIQIRRASDRPPPSLPWPNPRR